ncbi:SusC/RagA family TonB-linked outer membrane protein [Sphingobacterium haloxyli]|uniref:SusC/RagA family TonB-linked outer membrane protein n=1 Tax=Sphingobacterium haloxyli TaxID=2100533 RepID=A0A2S9J965_9SPHI|nr:TonB-dependent receptor [Sphingobacterium haloxyli]PRD49304.1 SusC/RagA family TonB-linked outer membrane protein [Sphingobacterium haloxyli]
MKSQFFLRRELLRRGVGLLCLLLAIFSLQMAMAAGSFHREAIHSELFVNVTGKVIDPDGNPVIGATVSIKGTTTGTKTDVDGVFRINLPQGDEILVISYVGYKTQEYPVNNQKNVSVTLEPVDALDEVVVVGYGTQKKAHLTGAVETVDMEAIQDLPATNIGAALTGRIAGLGVSGGTARPGSKATLEVRTPIPFGKDAGTTEPLYVIDGMIQVNEQNVPESTLFNNLDPSEIESISILKDGAAAVYGVRGANGVVLVTTKRGKEGQPKISYNGSYAINDAVSHAKMMNAYEFGQYFNIMNGKNGANVLPTDDNYPNRIFSEDELEHFKTIDYNWLDDAWKASYNTRHALSVSGGSDRATYFGGVTYSKQNGNLGTLDYNKWNFRAGTDVKVSSNFKVALQVSGNEDQLDKTFNKVSGEGPEDDYRNLLLAAPYVPAFIDGMPAKLPGTANDLSAYHFFEIERLGNLAETDSRFFSVNISAEYEAPFLEGLKARATYSRNTRHSVGSQIGTKYDLYQFIGRGQHNHIYEGATLDRPITVSNGNRLYYSNRSGNNTQINFFLTYEKQIGKHNFNGLFSVERGEAEGQQEDVWKSDPLETTNGQFGTAFGEVDGRTFANESGSLGYIGRVNYRYGEKYLAEFLFRTDASTKFAPENYWGRFYSLSAGWVVSEEDFFKSVKGIDYLKFRYSAGLMGNDQFPAWNWRQRFSYQVGKGPVFGGDENANTGMSMGRSPNRDATWSDEFKNNLGIEARFLNSRLSTTIDGYFNKGTNILLERIGNMPVTVGGSIAPENYAAVNSYGYEISLGWNDRIGKDFRYGVSTRFSWGDSKIITMDRSAADQAYPWVPSEGTSADVGKWGHDYLGMFKSQEEIDAYVSEYNITSVFGTAVDQLKPGMLYYRDVRGPLQADGTFAEPDGVIDDNDWVKLSDREANNYGFGITLKAGYKSFSFETVIAGSFGGWAEIGGSERKKLNNDISRVYDNRPIIWNDIWDPELNPNGTMPNPNWENMYNLSSNFWKVSPFRMQVTSFNLGYSLPAQLLDNLKVSNARLYFSAINPLGLYQAYSYRDTYGGAWNSYPNLKTFSFGLNLTL